MNITEDSFVFKVQLYCGTKCVIELATNGKENEVFYDAPDYDFLITSVDVTNLSNQDAYAYVTVGHNPKVPYRNSTNHHRGKEKRNYKMNAFFRPKEPKTGEILVETSFMFGNYLKWKTVKFIPRT